MDKIQLYALGVIFWDNLLYSRLVAATFELVALKLFDLSPGFLHCIDRYQS